MDGRVGSELWLQQGWMQTGVPLTASNHTHREAESVPTSHPRAGTSGSSPCCQKGLWSPGRD